jgi:hypothetical protein
MSRWSSWWRSGPRVSGRPPSGNGASSFHLNWGPVDDALGVSVVLEVLEAPSVPALYFWALQADMVGPRGRAGGAHLGLQWYPHHPGSTAVNWGGYAAHGGELAGSDSRLPSATGNPNTRDLAWRAGRAYRLSIRRVEHQEGPSGTTRWRGAVQDLTQGDQVDVRDLYMDGDRIVGATMWSEVFARCDDPSVAVRWSTPMLHLADGDVAVDRVQVNYQSHDAGGCANTDSAADGVGLVQRTSVERRTPQGVVLAVPGEPPR